MHRPSGAERPARNELNRQTKAGLKEGPDILFNKRASLKTKAHCWLLALCAMFSVCVCMLWRGDCMYDCICVCVCQSVSFIHPLAGLPRPSVYFTSPGWVASLGESMPQTASRRV